MILLCPSCYLLPLLVIVGLIIGLFNFKKKESNLLNMKKSYDKVVLYS